MLDPVNGTICGPVRVVKRFRQVGMPGLGRTLGIAGIVPVELRQFVTAPAGVEKPFIVEPMRRLADLEIIVAEDHHLTCSNPI